MATKSTAEWVDILEEHNVWNAPVNDYAAVVEDPQVPHNACFLTLPGAAGTPITLVTHPIRYDGQVPGVRFPPQPLGAQTAQVLEEIGYPEAEIADLEREGIVHCHRPGRPKQPSQKAKRRR